MLGKLTGQEETHGCLDFSTSQGGLVVVAGKIDGLVGESLEDIVHERVHDSHSTLADTHIGVHLLQYTVNVGGVCFQSSSLAVGEITLRLRSQALLLGAFAIYSQLLATAPNSTVPTIHLLFVTIERISEDLS